MFKYTENEMLNLCKEWLDMNDNYNIHIINKEDDDTYHQRVYIASKQDDKIANISIIRIFGLEGQSPNLSEDYNVEVNVKNVIHIIPNIIEVAKRVG